MSIQKRKAVFIGAGHVGSHGAYALISQGLVEEVVFIDIDEEKAKAQATDLYDASLYLPRHSVVRAGTYEDVDDAQVVIVAAGPLPQKGQSDRQQTLKANVECIDEIVKGLKTSSFDGIIIDISNPADVITHYLQHQLDWPKERIISTSTTLDSARVRRALAKELGIDQKSVAAYVLGEHGEAQFVPWSQVTVGGKSLLGLMKEQPDRYGHLDLGKIEADARRSGWDILWGKGSTEFGIGASIAEVVRAILCDEHRILPISTYLDGVYGVRDTYASVPAVLTADGVAEVIELDLTEEEKRAFAAASEKINTNYRLALSFQEE